MGTLRVHLAENETSKNRIVTIESIKSIAATATLVIYFSVPLVHNGGLELGYFIIHFIISLRIFLILFLQ